MDIADLQKLEVARGVNENCCAFMFPPTVRVSVSPTFK
jgi:hypothetical protein